MSRKNRRIRPKIIAIEGIHGVGKTTAFDILKKKLSGTVYRFYPERLAHKPLWPFGSKDKQIAFRSEIHFMQQMIERNKKIGDDIKNFHPKICLLDRSAISVLVYSKALDLDVKDLRVLYDLYRSVKWAENVIIYLEARPEIILKRIKKRGMLDPERLEWNEDDYNYIKELEKNYNYYLKVNEKKFIIIRINTSDLTPEDTAAQIIRCINDIIPKKIPPRSQMLIDTYINSS